MENTRKKEYQYKKQQELTLSAMERAGSEDIDPDAERKGLGTPATRAAVIEKLVDVYKRQIYHLCH